MSQVPSRRIGTYAISCSWFSHEPDGFRVHTMTCIPECAVLRATSDLYPTVETAAREGRLQEFHQHVQLMELLSFEGFNIVGTSTTSRSAP